MKNVLKPLAKSLLISLGLRSAADVAIQRKIFGSGTTLIISNEVLDDIMKRVKYLKDTGLLIKGFSEKIKNEAKNKMVDFLGCY